MYWTDVLSHHHHQCPPPVFTTTSVHHRHHRGITHPKPTYFPPQQPRSCHSSYRGPNLATNQNNKLTVKVVYSRSKHVRTREVCTKKKTKKQLQLLRNNNNNNKYVDACVGTCIYAQRFMPHAQFHMLTRLATHAQYSTRPS